MKKPTVNYKYKCVLLIDDSEMDNFINEKMLETNFYSEKVYVSTNGKKALELINNLVTSFGATDGTYPEVIFVDLNMPIMDGFEFIEHFKKIDDQKLQACKLAILTSSINDSDKHKAEEIGNDIIFLNKPLTNQILEVI